MNLGTCVLASVLLGCIACEAEPTKPTPPAPAPAHQSLPAEKATSGAPLYDLKATLTAHDGRKIGLDQFRGRPVLISMFYGSCPYACPTLISDIKRIERQLPPESREGLRVLLVSFDPERDTPARLQELIATHGLDQRRWILASASDSDALSLAAALGIRYRKLPSGGFNHTSLITLLDPSGRIVAQSEGLNRDNVPILQWLANRT